MSLLHSVVLCGTLAMSSSQATVEIRSKSNNAFLRAGEKRYPDIQECALWDNSSEKEVLQFVATGDCENDICLNILAAGLTKCSDERRMLQNWFKSESDESGWEYAKKEMDDYVRFKQRVISFDILMLSFKVLSAIVLYPIGMDSHIYIRKAVKSVCYLLMASMFVTEVIISVMRTRNIGELDDVRQVISNAIDAHCFGAGKYLQDVIYIRDTASSVSALASLLIALAWTDVGLLLIDFCRKFDSISFQLPDEEEQADVVLRHGIQLVSRYDGFFRELQANYEAFKQSSLRAPGIPLHRSGCR